MRFYFVDKVLAFEKGRRIRGIKNVSMSEPYFTVHFQRYPVMPGVLILESLAQLAGFLIELSLEEGDSYRKALLTIVDKSKFRAMVRPGDRLDMTAEVVNLARQGAACSVRAEVDGELVTETLLTFALGDVSFVYDDYLEAERNALIATLMRDIPGYGHTIGRG